MTEDSNFSPSRLKGLIGLAVSRPVGVTMLTLAMVVFGYVSYQKLSVNLMPDISYPTLTVRTEYLGAPSDVEEIISRPQEQILGIIHNLVNISSVSRADVADVILEFTWGTDMDDAAQTVREKLGQVTLPKEATKPLLLRYDPTMDPILRLGLYGVGDEYAMRYVAENEIRREIESIAGVAAVKVSGGLERQITVDLDRSLLEKYQLDVRVIINRLKEENINVASGRLKEAETEYLVRSVNQFQTIKDIEDLVVARVKDEKVRIRDVGKVTLGHEEREVITRIQGHTSVEIAIYKEGDANLVAVADRVKMALLGTVSPSPEVKSKAKKRPGKQAPTLAERLPDGMRLSILSDQSIFIKEAIYDLEVTAITGAALAVAVLMMFLKKLSSTAIIGVTIPLSIIATFACMYMGGVSLNIMSLGGLALGVGMLVDTSIVVLEAIFRRREQGEDFVLSAVEGTQEVAGAITASTLTTVCVFFPIVFVEGIAGQVFKDQALAVVFSLLTSLVLALFVIPMLVTRKFRHSDTRHSTRFRHFAALSEIKQYFGTRRALWKTVIGSPFAVTRFLLFLAVEFLGKLSFAVAFLLFFVAALLWRLLGFLCRWPARAIFYSSDRVLEFLYGRYARALKWSLTHRFSVVAATSLLFIAAVLLAFDLERDLIPKVKQGEFTLEVFLPVGTPLEKTDEILKPFEEKARDEPGVAVVSSSIGVEKDSLSSEGGEHSGKIHIRLAPGHFEDESAIIDSCQKRLLDQPEISEVKIRYPALFTFKTPIEVEIQGYNLQELKSVTASVVEALKRISGLYNVRSNIKRGNPEIQIEYQRDLLAQYRLGIDDISYRVKNLLGGLAGRYVLKDKNIDILVQLQNARDLTVNELENLNVGPVCGQPKKLKDVARVNRVEGFSEIRRINQQRAALVSADLSRVSLSSAVARMDEEISGIAIPDDFHLGIAGQNQEMEVSLTSLKFALALAIFLVYVVLASQFESLLQPFVIIMTLPLALIGVVLVLYALSLPVSIVVYIGMILLSGIVVNNAIVLIDCINQQLEKGNGVEEAVMAAGHLRLRPILMTTLTTVLGLLPMIGILGSGEGKEIRAPMAITVITGLTSSTILTLVVIPVVFTLVEDLKAAMGYGQNSPDRKP